MHQDDFTLQNINSDIHNQLKEQKDLNFCKILVHAYKENMSITAKYDPPENYVSLSEKGLSSLNDFYYGVSPGLDPGELIRCISNLELLTADALSNYISQHGDWFMVRNTQKDYLPALARYIVICMASHFGIRIKMNSYVYNDLLCFLKERGYSDDNINAILSYSEKWNASTAIETEKLWPKESYLTIKGCPTDEVICFLKRYRYHHICNEQAIPLIDKSGKEKGSVDAWEMADNNSASEKDIDITEVYFGHTELIGGRVFYSGVLLKPTRIEIARGIQENYKIKSLCIHFERSTYGAVCALDRNLTEHPLLDGIKSKIIEMLRNDDSQKLELANQIEQIENSELTDSETSIRMIEAVNQYLAKCLNVNQIGVSANIVTSDGFMLLGQRSQGNIDNGHLYPGVNGNSEIADKNVSFYSLSAYEDYPTIRLDSDRIDFYGEIGREAYAELNLNLPKQEWGCCGIIISGNMPKEINDSTHYLENQRRLHFNIIFEHHTDKSFQEIEELSKKATEAFETKRYLGIKVECEKNRWKHFLNTIRNSIISIVSHKDFIEAAVAIVVFLLTITRAIDLNLTEIIALSLSVAVIIGTCIRIYKDNIFYWRLHNERRIRHIRIYHQEMSYDDVNKNVARVLRKRGDSEKLYTFHPATYACLRVFVDSIVREAISPKDRR